MIKRIKGLVVALGFIPTLFIGAAPSAFADGISDTGPGSSNTISTTNNTNVTVTNNNNVTITNQSTQTASSGNATVSGNTTGGNATSGNASNGNATAVDVAVNNPLDLFTSGDTDGDASIANTGPDSSNIIHSSTSTHVSVTNNNNVTITNRNYQTATSGDAKVSGNTTGGNATSGDASNDNQTCISVHITNGGLSSAGDSCAQPPVGGRGGGTPEAGGLGGGSLLASLTGGKGSGDPQLPNTGAGNGISTWAIAATLTFLSSIVYWRLAIAPKLKAL